MQKIGLKTQFYVVIAFVLVFSLGAGVSQWLRVNAETSATLSLHRDLAVAVKIARLKSLFQQMDMLTLQYLETGELRWLDRRRDTIDKVRKTEADLSAILPGQDEQQALRDLRVQFEKHLREEKPWLREKLSGRLTARDIARIRKGRENYQGMMAMAMTMHDVRIETFQGRFAAARRASARAFFVMMGIGLLASALCAFFLSRYIINPIDAVAAYARGWKLGQPWALNVPTASPEIDSLAQHIRGLTENLNEEYSKERDLGRFKSQMVSMVSHELNNALSVIYAAAASLEDTEPGRQDERRERMYRILKVQTLSLSTTIGNLLNIGRLESGHLALNRKKMEIETVLRSGGELMEILCENKGLNLSLSFPESPVPVYGDPDALMLVVTNLLSNAVKYTPEGGSITAGVQCDGEHPAYVRVFVKDTGIGLTREDKERIFSIYYRSERGKKLARGFGLGLALAKTIIEAHGGSLEVEGEPGKGSMFAFLLPIWNSKSDTARAQS
jgi:signal transduction histidine kinase